MHLLRVHLSVPESCLLPGKSTRTLPESPAWLRMKVSSDGTSGIGVDEEPEAVLVSGLSTAAVHCHVGVGAWGEHISWSVESNGQICHSCPCREFLFSPWKPLPEAGNLAVFGLHNLSFNTHSTGNTENAWGSLRNSLGSLKC